MDLPETVERDILGVVALIFLFRLQTETGTPTIRHPSTGAVVGHVVDFEEHNLSCFYNCTFFIFL